MKEFELDDPFMLHSPVVQPPPLDIKFLCRLIERPPAKLIFLPNQFSIQPPNNMAEINDKSDETVEVDDAPNEASCVFGTSLRDTSQASLVNKVQIDTPNTVDISPVRACNRQKGINERDAKRSSKEDPNHLKRSRDLQFNPQAKAHDLPTSGIQMIKQNNGPTFFITGSREEEEELEGVVKRTRFTPTQEIDSNNKTEGSTCRHDSDLVYTSVATTAPSTLSGNRSSTSVVTTASSNTSVERQQEGEGGSSIITHDNDPSDDPSASTTLRKKDTSCSPPGISRLDSVSPSIIPTITPLCTGQEYQHPKLPGTLVAISDEKGEDDARCRDLVQQKDHVSSERVSATFRNEHSFNDTSATTRDKHAREQRYGQHNIHSQRRPETAVPVYSHRLLDDNHHESKDQELSAPHYVVGRNLAEEKTSVDSWQAYMDQQSANDEQRSRSSTYFLDHHHSPPVQSKTVYRTAPYAGTSSNKNIQRSPSPCYPPYHHHQSTNFYDSHDAGHEGGKSGAPVNYGGSHAYQNYHSRNQYEIARPPPQGASSFQHNSDTRSVSKQSYHQPYSNGDQLSSRDQPQQEGYPPVPPLNEAHYLGDSKESCYQQPRHPASGKHPSYHHYSPKNDEDAAKNSSASEPGHKENMVVRRNRIVNQESQNMPSYADMSHQAGGDFSQRGNTASPASSYPYLGAHDGHYHPYESARDHHAGQYDPHSHYHYYHGSSTSSAPVASSGVRRSPILAGSSSSISSYHNQQTTMQPFYNRQILALSTDDDENWLSEFLCFVRSGCVEVFPANREDVASRMNSKKVLLGQVGIRCRFCAHVPHRERTGRSSSFPSSINRIYQSLTMMLRDHFTKCHAMPPSTKERYLCLKANASQGATDSKKYWIVSAHTLGLVDSDEGIRFQNRGDSMS